MKAGPLAETVRPAESGVDAGATRVTRAVALEVAVVTLVPAAAIRALATMVRRPELRVALRVAIPVPVTPAVLRQELTVSRLAIRAKP